MANRNPYQARLAKALRQKPGNLDATKRRTWGVLCLAYDEVATAADADQRRKAMLAYAQLASVYLKLYEVAELEPRIQALEAAADRNGSQHGTIA
jgi:uncharacterized small protein (DUF1192 family)